MCANEDYILVSDYDIEDILAKLTLKEKVSLLSGKDFWSTYSYEDKGLQKVTVTDGPHGVRIGNESSDRKKTGTATAFPTGVAMASTWDVELIKEVAVALAKETRANDCDVLLGPCVNIVRTPVAGRNFETYSEDPFLSGKIGTAYVQGLQSLGIGASLKHFACNNQEIERTRGSSEVDERTLREIYLTAFEMIVKEANPWTVMCSYNRINGVHASQNKHLLTDILKNEWGYDGVVVSDWNANHTIVDSIKAGLDLEMPGPSVYYGKFLEEAVKTWQVDIAYIDEAVKRIIRLSKRVEDYKSDNPEDRGAFSNEEHVTLAKKVAADSAVLLKNNHELLPIHPKSKEKLAVIGPLANHASYGGGGSSIVSCAYTTTPLEGLKTLISDDVEVVYHKGCDDKEDFDHLESSGVHLSYEGESGVRESFFNNRKWEGESVNSSIVYGVDYWTIFPPEGVSKRDFSLIWEGNLNVDESGDYDFQFLYQGNFKLTIDDQLISEENDWSESEPYPFYTRKQGSIFLDANRTYKFKMYFFSTQNHDRQAMILQAKFNRTEDHIASDIQKAIEIAKQADYVILIAGHATGFEHEDGDRVSLDLPGQQNRLIQSVAEAVPQVCVVLSTGAPIVMPWINQVDSIVQGHFYGQEGGNALAEILLGHVNPSGHLTTSYPIRYEDNPSYINYPGKEYHIYGEGVFVGYRYYDYKRMDVLFPFGHGLSYTKFQASNMQISGSLNHGKLIVQVDVENIGEKTGSVVLQLYVEPISPTINRPIKELKGFKKIKLEKSQKRTIKMDLDYRSFMHYDTYKSCWTLSSKQYKIHIGYSSRNIQVTKDFLISD